jgi:3-oxoacyl-[acyl-carrier protein] reductase
MTSTSPSSTLDRLDGIVALVTGGSRGIGLGTAMELARRGADVAVVARDGAAARAAAEGIASRHGVRAFGTGANVAEAAAVASAFDSCEASLGRIGVLVNAAGIMTPRLGPLVETPAEHLEEMFDVHVRGAFLCCQRVLPGMIEAGFGRIVNVSSVLGMLGLPYRSSYAVAKHGVVGLTRSLAVEVARQGITVNAVAPGYILTETLASRVEQGILQYATYADRAPIGRWGVAEEVGHLIAFLALPASGFMTGTVIPVDGGYTMRGDPGESIGPALGPESLDSVRARFAATR